MWVFLNHLKLWSCSVGLIPGSECELPPTIWGIRDPVLSFCTEHSLKSVWHAFNKMLETFPKESGRLRRLNDAQLVLRDLMWAKKISPTTLHHLNQPESLTQGRMDPCIHVDYFKFWSYQQKLPSLLPLPSAHWGPSFQFLADMSGTWSSPGVAHPGFDVLCDAFLRSTVKTSGY